LVKEAAQVVAQDCTIETDLEILIPDTYVSNTTERIGLYAKLDNIKNEEKLERFVNNLKDRFGPIPESVQDLIQTVRLRWLAEKLGFEKVILKNESMKCHFVPSEKEAYFQSETFGKVLAFVSQHPRECKMKEFKTRLVLRIDEVLTVNEAKDWLSQMLG